MLLPFLDVWHRICVSKTRESAGCDPWDWDFGRRRELEEEMSLGEKGGSAAKQVRLSIYTTWCVPCHQGQVYATASVP